MNLEKTWVTSDPHCGHKNLVESGFRKKGYEDRYFKAWDMCVKKDDVVWILGDLAFARQAYWLERLTSMPGKKSLVMGNHDTKEEAWYRKWGFEEVLPFGEYKFLPIIVGTVPAYYGQIMLTHVPAFVSVGTAYDTRFQGLMGKYERIFRNRSCILNIHGHTHGYGAEKHNTIDVGIDVVGEQLIRLDQVVNQKFPGIGV